MVDTAADMEAYVLEDILEVRRAVSGLCRGIGREKGGEYVI